MIEWAMVYSVNHPEIDEQHKVLIGMLNEMDAIITKEEFNYTNLIHTMECLEEYVKTHFSFEENLMLWQSYPDIMVHTKAHNIFRDKLQNTYVLDIEKPINFYNEMSQYLTDWLMNHIMNMDRHLGNYLKEKDSEDGR